MKRRGLTLHKELLTTNTANDTDGGTITISVTFGTNCPTLNLFCTNGCPTEQTCGASCGGGCSEGIQCAETRNCGPLSINTGGECQSILIE